jgi:superoxide dismutase, Fe-Mn family
MSSRSTVGLSRDLHTVKPLPFDTEVGLGDFLSPDALKVVAQEYQEGLLQRLNEEVLGE